MVESTLNYLAPMAEKPVYYLYEPPPGASWRNTKGDRRSLPICNARELAPEPSLAREGFALLRHATTVESFDDPDAVRASYYPEMEKLVGEATTTCARPRGPTAARRACSTRCSSCTTTTPRAPVPSGCATCWAARRPRPCCGAASR